MKSARLTDAEIRALGWEALVSKLGLSGALRFAIQTERGHGDYSEVRHRALGGLSVDDLVKLTRGKERVRSPRKRRGRQRAAGSYPRNHAKELASRRRG